MTDLLRRFRKRDKPPFTGNCLVRQHTGDGTYVGRCYHSTYGGVCHLHGDVSKWLAPGTQYGDWPDDGYAGK